MRWVGWILALILAVGWLASEIPPYRTSVPIRGESPRAHAQVIRGQAHSSFLQQQPRLHPLVVALEQVLLSLLALIAFPAGAAWRWKAASGPEHNVPPKRA